MSLLNRRSRNYLEEIRKAVLLLPGHPYAIHNLEYHSLTHRIQSTNGRREQLLASAERMMREKYPSMFTDNAMERLTKMDLTRFEAEFPKKEGEVRDLNLFTILESGFVLEKSWT